MVSGRRELGGFALEVIDLGHPWPRTLLCSLLFHQNLLLLRGKGNENRVVGSVLFLTETSRDPELKGANHSTFQEWRSIPYLQRKENLV